MKTLITGGAGAVGRYVVHEYLAHDLAPTILDLRPPTKRQEGVGFVQCDLLDQSATLDALQGYDVVVHLAAIPNPYHDPHDRVLSVNTTATFNVLEAIRLNGIPRIVYGCSESASGFGIHNTELKPLYLPVDEEHPCWPHEAYSLSKWFGEEMVANYARAYGIAGLAMRYNWVWAERDAPAVRGIIQANLRGERRDRPWFGGYIAPHDVARACRMAALYTFPAGQETPFEAFYLAAGNTFLTTPTLDALRSHFDPLPEIRDPGYFASNPFAPVFDLRKAERLLGFKPAKTWETFEQWEKLP
jgi:UDP-glucose 4-epimerase